MRSLRPRSEPVSGAIARRWTGRPDPSSGLAARLHILRRAPRPWRRHTTLLAPASPGPPKTDRVRRGSVRLRTALGLCADAARLGHLGTPAGGQLAARGPF